MLPKLISYMGLMLLLFACTHSGNNASSPATESSSTHPIIAFYRGPLNHLEGVRRGECPMYPSCSEYSRQAIAKHGFTTGWVMTMDRLMRCSRDETKLAPKVYVKGKWKSYDPLENNDFWWADNR